MPKNEPQKVDLESKDIVEDHKQKLKEVFPNVFNEDKIDFDRLKLALGEDVDAGLERYGITWPGKAECMKVIQQPSIGTLRPAKKESIDFDTTENLFIEGDNLEVLKLLQNSYYGKIKMIYIDPPYNTGNEFIYPDKYSESLETYLAYTGQVDEAGRGFSTNTETDGRFHSKWLNMMYPRLYLARNLLSDDGAIFISIDENEQSNLKRLCDEIFGEENFRNMLLTRRRVKSLNVQFADDGLRSMNVGFEYVLVYAKSNSFLLNSLRMEKKDIPTKGSWNVFWSGADRPTMRYELLGFTPATGQWRWSKDKAQAAVRNYEAYLAKYSKTMTLEEYWNKNNKQLKFIRRIPGGEGKNGGVQYWIGPSETTLRTTNWTDIEVSEIHKDFDLPFSNPKSLELLKTIISVSNEKNFTVLDFFAGSATTAHAVMDLNKEDGGSRKFICVQLPEPCGEESEAFKAGYPTISDISTERIRCAIKKIKEEQKGNKSERTLFAEKDGQAVLDLGFKVFKLDKSNFKLWESKTGEKNVATGIEKQLQLHIDHINPKATTDDILYELLLKSGFPLTTKVEEKAVAGKKVYSIENGALLICLEKALTKEVITEIARLEPARVICLDQGFSGNDQLKTNAVQIMKSHGVNDFRTV